MGIDAEMFARIRGKENWKTDDEVLHLAYMLGTTVGASNFYISHGNVFEKQHCLTVIKPWDWKEHGYYSELDGKVVWLQDGETIIADPDEQFIRVHFYGRYYGPGYERGNWPVIRMTAEFLEHHIPGCEVWYGGDSSGVCAKPFDSKARKKMNRHWLESGRRPYLGGWGLGPECAICKEPMTRSGGGAGRLFTYCDGCGTEEVVFPSGVRRRVPRGKSHFDVVREADGIAVA